jgi:radical SAM superfamily enzyme YgiQ (UPF0313 family)
LKLLLLAMPDTADVLDFSGRLPNLGIVSMAGSLPRHEVRVLDLVLARPRAGRALDRALATFRPDVVGLSAMTFQFDTLRRAALRVRRWNPRVPIVAGGYARNVFSGRQVASRLGV